MPLWISGRKVQPVPVGTEIKNGGRTYVVAEVKHDLSLAAKMKNEYVRRPPIARLPGYDPSSPDEQLSTETSWYLRLMAPSEEFIGMWI